MDNMQKKYSSLSVKKCQTFTDKFNAEYISKTCKNTKRWFELPEDKAVEVYKALEENGLLKKAKSKEKLIALAYRFGEVHGIMNAKYENEGESELIYNWRKLNFAGQKIALQLIDALLDEHSLQIGLGQKNLIRLVLRKREQQMIK